MLFFKAAYMILYLHLHTQTAKSEQKNKLADAHKILCNWNTDHHKT